MFLFSSDAKPEADIPPFSDKIKSNVRQLEMDAPALISAPGNRWFRMEIQTKVTVSEPEAKGALQIFHVLKE